MRRCAVIPRTLALNLVLLAAVCSMAVPSVLAQVPATVTQYIVDMWQEDDGLPQNYVSVILQARDGYIWLGTRNGVARFDGVRFTTYNDLRPGQLQESEVWALAEDDHGVVWAGTYGGGLSRIQDGRVTTYGVRDGLLSEMITALEDGPNGSLWIGTIAGLARRGEDGRFVTYGVEHGFPSVPVRALLDVGGVLWIGADNGLWSYAGQRFTHHSAERPGELAGRVNSLAADPEGGLWVSLQVGGTGAGLRRLKDGRITSFTTRDGLASDIVMSIAARQDGTVWVGTRRGLSRYTNGRFENYVSDVRGVGDRQMLERASLEGTSALAFDREGNLWFGTRLDGLGRLRESAFLRATVLDTTGQDLDVRAIHGGAGGGMWIGTANDLRLLQGDTLVVHRYGPGEGGSAADAITLDSHGRVLVGSGDGLWWLQRGRLERHPVAAAASIDISLLLTAARGDVWIGSRDNGAFRLSGRTLTPFTRAEGLLGSQVRGIGEDGDGAIWLATRDGGVTRLLDGRATRFGVQEGLLSPAAQALHVEQDGTAWVATRRGLNRIRRGRVAAVTASDGLPANYFYQIVDDDTGHFWLTHARGIVRVAKADLEAVADRKRPSLRAQSFGLDSGMKSTTMTVAHQPSAWRSPDGRLWFATARGVEVIDPGRTSSNPLAPPVLIEGLHVGREQRVISDGMTLKPTRAEIAIQFTALSFVAPSRVLFRYLLEGFDPGWVEAGTRRVAYYSNLRPGQYRFRVIACNNDGVWNEEGASFSFEVLPRWYERAGVRLLGLVSLGLAVIGLFRARVGQLKRRERDLAARVEERTHELRERTNELQELTATLEQRVSERTAEIEGAQEALASERERLAVTLASIADGVVATDVAGNVVLMNRMAEEITGRRPADVIGRRLPDVFPALNRNTGTPMPDPLQAVLTLKGPFIPEAPALVHRPDGREVLLAGAAAPIHDSRGDLVGAVLVFRDVTDRERIDEQLRNTQRLEALAVLAGGIAHDFNNLLTGVFGFVDVARDPTCSPERARDLLDRAVSVIEKARGLTRQLLTFSKAGEPVRTPLALEPLVRNAAGFVLAGSNVVAEVQVAPDLWRCEGDEQQVEQIVDNLLINARQAMPGGGAVVIALANVRLAADPAINRAAGPYVRLTVRDHGAGIPRELQARVFEPFYTTKPGGTGLGLATVYSIARKHGGHLEVESEPGAGAAFHVFLPAMSGSVPAEAQVAPLPAPPVAPRSGARILVMDDEDYVRDVARQMLTRIGYEVELAKDDSEAVGLLQAAAERGEWIDVAILDITIPGGRGGAAALERLRAIVPGLQAIASSGYSGDGIMARPQEHGFQAALPKPYTLANVRTVLARVLAART